MKRVTVLTLLTVLTCWGVWGLTPTSFLVPFNNAEGVLDAGIDEDDTELTLETGDGAAFPSTFSFHVTIGGTEIVEVTGRTGDVLTIGRGEESTPPVIHEAGETVRLNITAEYLSQVQAAVNVIEGMDVEDWPTSGGTGTAPVSDGANGLTMTDVVEESELAGGVAALDVESMATSGGAGTAPVSDGASGLSMEDVLSVSDTAFLAAGELTLRSTDAAFYVKSDTDLYFQVDADGGGTNQWYWLDGTGATAASMDETGSLTVGGVFTNGALSAPIYLLPGGGNSVWNDTDTNTLMTLDDMGTTGKLTVSGDLYAQDGYFNGGDIKTSSGNLTIAPAGGVLFIAGYVWPAQYVRSGSYYGHGGSADGTLTFQSTYVKLATGSNDPLYLDAGGNVEIRDVDSSNATRFSVDTSNGNTRIYGTAQVDGNTTLGDAEADTTAIAGPTTLKCSGTGAAETIAQRFGKTATEGAEIRVLDEAVVLATSLTRAMTVTLPAGAVILSVQSNINAALTAAGGATKFGVGTSPLGDPDKYLLSGTTLTKNHADGKKDKIPAWAVLSSTEQIYVTACDDRGEATGTLAGTVRVRVVYLALNSLDDAA